MITETTRRCPRCSQLVDGNVQECPNCKRQQAPPIASWPDGAKRFLFLLALTDALSTKLQATEQQQMERLLERAVRGRWYPGGKLITYAANAAECYPQFLELLDKWKAQGSPTDFAAIAQIRGGRDC